MLQSTRPVLRRTRHVPAAQMPRCASTWVADEELKLSYYHKEQGNPITYRLSYYNKENGDPMMVDEVTIRRNPFYL